MHGERAAPRGTETPAATTRQKVRLEGATAPREPHRHCAVSLMKSRCARPSPLVTVAGGRPI